MPFINYKVGDQIEFFNDKKMFNGQIIKKIYGRTSEIIFLENGSTLTGPGFTILFKDLPVEYYFIEKTGNNMITCSIIPCKSFTNKHKEIICSTFKNVMGSDSRFNLKLNAKIKYTKNGKIKYFAGNQN